MNRYSDEVSTLPWGRVVSGLRWRADAMRTRVRDVRADGLSDHIRCLLELGFPLPPLYTMQNYWRLKFLHDCIAQLAPSTGVALEVGCYKCSSTVFIAHACARAHVNHVYAIDLFTGTPSWNGSVDYFDEAQGKLARYGLTEQVTLIRHHSLTYSWTEPIAALHIDADHAYEAVWNDIQKYTPFVVENGIVVFDDYDVSHPGVTRAVHRLLNENPSFEVAGANYQGAEFGSLCLRRTRPA
jgi:predicted O-methyltransferase YrrM